MPLSEPLEPVLDPEEDEDADEGPGAATQPDESGKHASVWTSADPDETDEPEEEDEVDPSFSGTAQWPERVLSA